MLHILNNQKQLYIIAGPTASGKTDKSIQMALEFRCPIISADSRQVYKELNIGVAKPDQAQLTAVQHYFINHVSIHEDYNAGQYALEARTLINTLFEHHNQLIVCGGTGLYIKSLLKGLDQLPGKNETLRQALQNTLDTKGIEALQNELKELNPERYAAIDIQNPQRLIRAIEIEKTETEPGLELPAFSHAFDTIYEIIDRPREELYNRINQRVDTMVNDGLEQEALSFNHLRHLNALQTVGYSEWWPFFDGEYSRTEAIEKIKQHTRNYAKRQITWFKHQLK